MTLTRVYITNLETIEMLVKVLNMLDSMWKSYELYNFLKSDDFKKFIESVEKELDVDIVLEFVKILKTLSSKPVIEDFNTFNKFLTIVLESKIFTELKLKLALLLLREIFINRKIIVKGVKIESSY